MADNKQANVYAAFAAAQAEFKAPAQSGVNPHFKSRYSTLGDIFAAALPALHKHGLAFTQTIDTQGDEVTLRSVIFLAETGQSIESRVPIPAQANAQALGSMISYLKRYSAAAMFAVVDGMDDDGNAASEPQAQRPASAGAAKRQMTEEPAEYVPEPGKVTAPQLKALHAMGTNLYGDEWDAKRPELVAAISKGNAQSSKQLTINEAKQLMDGMSKKLRERTEETSG